MADSSPTCASGSFSACIAVRFGWQGRILTRHARATSVRTFPNSSLALWCGFVYYCCSTSPRAKAVSPSPFNKPSIKSARSTTGLNSLQLARRAASHSNFSPASASYTTSSRTCSWGCRLHTSFGHLLCLPASRVECTCNSMCGPSEHPQQLHDSDG